MESTQKILENLRHKRKFIGNALALLAGLSIVLTIIFRAALPAYTEITLLLAKRQEQAEILAKVTDFANKHVDYAAYEKQKYQELANLQQSLWQLTDSNQAQNKLQRLAQKQNLVIQQLQCLSEDRKKAVIKMEVTGNYFALLRWLKQIEKLLLTVQKIEIKGQANGNVCAVLLLQGTFAARE